MPVKMSGSPTKKLMLDDPVAAFEAEAKRKREAEFRRKQQERQRMEQEKKEADKEERRRRDELRRAEADTRAAAEEGARRLCQGQARLRVASEMKRQEEDQAKERETRASQLAKAKEMADTHSKKVQREEADQAAREKQAVADRARDRAETMKHEEHLEQMKQKSAAEIRATKRRLAQEDASNKAKEKRAADRATAQRNAQAARERQQAEADKRAAEKEEALENHERQLMKIAQEQKLKDEWAAARGSASKSASTVAFDELHRQEMKHQKEDAAWKALAAQEQRFRLDREKTQAEIDRSEWNKRELEGKRVRDRVVTKKREAEEQRKREVAQAAAELKLDADADMNAQAVLEKMRQKEAVLSRKMIDDQKAEAVRLKEEARAKQLQVDRERNAKGGESSIAIKKMKDMQDAEEAMARRKEWMDRQALHKATVEAERQQLHEVQKDFNYRPHGQHSTSSLGGSWSEPENAVDMREAKKRFSQAKQDREKAEADQRAADKEFTREMNEKQRQTNMMEQKLKAEWAAARGSASKSASTVAFEEFHRQEMKHQKEDAAWKALAAQEQRFRLDREKTQAEIDRSEWNKRELEGKRVRDRVVTKKREAEEQRKREVAQAAAELKLDADADMNAQAVLEKMRQKEAVLSRKMIDDQKAEAVRLKEEARAKQLQVDRERNAKGGESSIAIKKMKDMQEADLAKARRKEWMDRQKAHEQEVQAETKHLHEVQKEFHSVPHHIHTPLGDAW